MNKIGKILSIDSKYVISLNRDACFEMCKDCLNIIKKAHPDFDYTYLHSNTGGATYFRLDAGKYPEIDDMRGMFDWLEVLVPWEEMQLPEDILNGVTIFPDALSEADRLRIMKLIISHIWEKYKKQIHFKN